MALACRYFVLSFYFPCTVLVESIGCYGKKELCQNKLIIKKVGLGSETTQQFGFDWDNIRKVCNLSYSYLDMQSLIFIILPQRADHIRCITD